MTDKGYELNKTTDDQLVVCKNGELVAKLKVDEGSEFCLIELGNTVSGYIIRDYDKTLKITTADFAKNGLTLVKEYINKICQVSFDADQDSDVIEAAITVDGEAVGNIQYVGARDKGTDYTLAFKTTITDDNFKLDNGIDEYFIKPGFEPSEGGDFLAFLLLAFATICKDVTFSI